MNEASNEILRVSHLTVSFRSENGLRKAVSDVSFSIRRGEMLALVGESGSGKSVTSLAVMGLLPRETAVIESGELLFCGENLLDMPAEGRRSLRGKRMSMIFQEPMTALNPVLTVGWQLSEVLVEHEGLSQRDAKEKSIELLEQVGIPSANLRFDSYPHQLSGGMRQRVMIAMALACRPELLIADEPTTALDVTVQAQIMELLNDLRQRIGMSVLFITHNLALVHEQAQHVAVMVSGHLVETARTGELFREPCHPYTRLLLRSIPQAELRGRRLAAIEVPPKSQDADAAGCAFADRCPYCLDVCRTSAPEVTTFGAHEHTVSCHCTEAFTERLAHDGGDDVGQRDFLPSDVLTVSGLKVWFPVCSGLFGRVKGYVKAVDGIDLTLRRGETLALVGESGCGKTTVGKALVHLQAPTAGRIVLDNGVDIAKLSSSGMRPYRRKIQMIFQDPFSSLDPRQMMGESLSEGMMALGLVQSQEECEAKLQALVEKMGLPSDSLMRYPHQFSGGQRQRIGLARALSVSPDIIVCDECTSALDVSVQAQILNLQKRLQRESGVSYLFITHDLSVVSYFADRVAVMYLGRIVERGDAVDVFSRPMHPYTEALLAAAPRLDREGARKLRLSGDVPSPLKPPAGCHFHPRCPYCTHRCRFEAPPVRDDGNGHVYTCWREPGEA